MDLNADAPNRANKSNYNTDGFVNSAYFKSSSAAGCDNVHGFPTGLVAYTSWKVKTADSKTVQSEPE